MKNHADQHYSSHMPDKHCRLAEGLVPFVTKKRDWLKGKLKKWDAGGILPAPRGRSHI
jgi:hypothetical protein